MVDPQHKLEVKRLNELKEMASECLIKWGQDKENVSSICNERLLILNHVYPFRAFIEAIEDRRNYLVKIKKSNLYPALDFYFLIQNLKKAASEINAVQKKHVIWAPGEHPDDQIVFVDDELNFQ